MPLSAKFNINEKIVDDKTEIALFKAMLKMFNTAKRLVPVDTGGLRNSIRLNPSTKGSKLYTLSANKEYAAAVEFGTAPHIIEPSEKKALSFKVSGKNVVTRKVQHPGTRPQPYFRPALFQMKNKDLKVVFKDTFKK